MKRKGNLAFHDVAKPIEESISNGPEKDKVEQNQIKRRDIN